MNGNTRADIGQTPSRPRHRDAGFTLVEILIVIVILGILATVTVFAVRGTTANAEEQACRNELKSLSTAVEAHFVRVGTRAIVATGVGDDRFEQTLVDAQILRNISENYDIDGNGDVTVDAAGICA